MKSLVPLEARKHSEGEGGPHYINSFYELSPVTVYNAAVKA